MEYPSLYQRMKEIESTIDEGFIKLEDTRNGEKTLKIQKEGKGIYLHSKYDPVREASTILDQYEKTEVIDEDVYVIFYGVGLGYHIDLFVHKYNNISFSIYEPIEEIMYHFLSNKNLQKLALKNINCIAAENREEDREIFFREMLKNKDKRIIVFPLPSYEKNFPKNYEVFLQTFKEMVIDERSSWGTNYAFQKRWVSNSMRNFKEVLRSPNILLNKKGQFEGKPAVLVAAGPSLDDEIEHLRYIKEKDLAYIFTVGSAINTLIHHNIYPHAACTYDPSKENQKVFQNIVEKDIKEIPLVFGSSVAFEILQKYPGKKLHMITSQDVTAAYYLKARSGEMIQGVMDAPSIAVITLQLLYELGFGKIILVGQNLAYLNEKNYADGIDYHKKLVTNGEFGNSIKVKDVYGREIMTNDSYNRMRQQMEAYLEEFKGIEVINATKGGAHIQGTIFIPLNEVIENDLRKPVVNKNWYIIDNKNYDTEHMKQQMKKMDIAYKKAKLLFKEAKEILNKIEKLAKSRNFQQLEKMYQKLDIVFPKIQKNHYLNTFILPRNRVSYQIFISEMTDIQRENSKIKRAEGVINAVGKLIFACERDMTYVEKAFQKIHEEIKIYIDDEEVTIKGTNSDIMQELPKIKTKEEPEKLSLTEEKKTTECHDTVKEMFNQIKKQDSMIVEKLSVEKNDTLKYTMEVIDQNAKGIALVIDDNGRLEGTVTDGDIRRAIIKGICLEEYVENVMNKNFIFVNENYSEKFIRNIFDQKSIFQIPVLDEEMKVIDIIFYQDFIKKPTKENWAVIMAGGIGRRLMPLTMDTPKPMLSVGSKPILETIIEQLKTYGYENILLCLNYKSHIIENYFQDGKAFDVNIQYIKEEKPLGTAGAIKLAQSYLQEPFLVINGDILTKLNFDEFMNYHEKHQNKITIAARRHEFEIPYGVLAIENEKVASLKEKPSTSMFINGGIYCLSPETINDIPENQYFNITELIQKAIDKNEKVGSFPITEYWMDIGQVEDYHQANTDYQELFRREASATKE